MITLPQENFMKTYIKNNLFSIYTCTCKYLYS